VAVLCNLAQATPSSRAKKVADVILANVLEPAPTKKADQVAVSTEVLRGYAGVYKSEKGHYIKVEVKDGKLMLSTYGIELVPKSTNVFTSSDLDGTVTFSSTQMVLDQSDEKPKSFTRVPTEKPKELSVFAGDYYSPELDATWEIRFTEGQLMAHVKHDPGPALPLEAISQNLFLVAGGSMQFDMQAGQRSRAFVSIARIRNLEFVRTN
jgi:hypothetical protein